MTLDLETCIDNCIDTEETTTKVKKVRNKSTTGGIRKAGRPYKRMSDDKLKTYVIQLRDRVEVVETKFKLYSQRLKKYLAEEEIRRETPT